MLKIIFVGHTQTSDNVAGIATGWANPELTDEGVRQARHIGQLLKDTPIDAAYSADLLRAYQTAGFVLEDRHIPIIQDRRLREVDFGQFTGHPRSEIHLIKTRYIDQPYPGGESHHQVVHHYREFLSELKHDPHDRTVLLCASGVYPLEVIVNHRATADVLADKVSTYKEFLLA